MNMPKIVIKLLVEYYDKELGDFLKKRLTEKLQKLSPDVEVKSYKVGKYYKQFIGSPELTECFFYVYSKNKLKVKEIAALFDVKWNFASYMISAYRDDIKCEYNYEDILWYRLIDEKMFLHKNVDWVMIGNNELDLDFDYHHREEWDCTVNLVKPKKSFLINFLLNVINYDDNLKNKIFIKLQNIISKCDPKAYIEFSNIMKHKEMPGVTEIVFDAYFPIQSSITVKKIIDFISVKRYYYCPPDEHGRLEETIWSDYEDGGVFLCRDVKWAHIQSLKNN